MQDIKKTEQTAYCSTSTRPSSNTKSRVNPNPNPYAYYIHIGLTRRLLPNSNAITPLPRTGDAAGTKLQAAPALRVHPTILIKIISTANIPLLNSIKLFPTCNANTPHSHLHLHQQVTRQGQSFKPRLPFPRPTNIKIYLFSALSDFSSMSTRFTAKYVSRF